MKQDPKKIASTIEAMMTKLLIAISGIPSAEYALSDSERKDLEEAITGCLVEQGFDRDEVIKNLNELIAIQRKEIAELKSNKAAIK
ncbi:MAG: hypothetical protein IKM83_06830 [Paludibacteraceae bacterium]|nr:hypothetical protein [Paludibacteraceae bacterium]